MKATLMEVAYYLHSVNSLIKGAMACIRCAHYEINIYNIWTVMFVYSLQTPIDQEICLTGL